MKIWLLNSFICSCKNEMRERKKEGRKKRKKEGREERKGKKRRKERKRRKEKERKILAIIFSPTLTCPTSSSLASFYLYF
jgi:hypothetical protein